MGGVDEDGLSLTTLRPNNKMSLVSPNTPNTMVICIGALVRRRDGVKSVIFMVEIYFYNLNK